MNRTLDTRIFSAWLGLVATLPQRIYLDASVLMPAIVEGHPLHAVYWPVLERLRKQVSELGGEVTLVAPTEFLNEIVTHRTRAIREVREAHFEDPDRLEREARLYGADALNVFVAAYATHVGRDRKSIPFSTFLNNVAPYSTEEALERFLVKLGIRVEKLARGSPDLKPMAFWEWFNPLRGAYEDSGRWGESQKATVLIEHEAWQLLRLEEEQRSGTRAVFVTADGRLRRAVSSIRGAALADALFSGVIMVNLVDLLLGVRVDHRALARLLWGVHALDPDGTLHMHFTDLGLQKKDEVSTLALPAVVSRIMQEVRNDPSYETLPLTSKDVVDRASVAKFLDRFEDRFYDLLDATVREWQEKQEGERARVKTARSLRSRKRKGRW